MKEKNTIKNKVIFIGMIVCIIILFSNSVSAASFSVSASTQTAQPGQNVTITINCSELYGRFNLSATNADLSQSSIFSQGSNVSVTATVGSSGIAQIIVTAVDVVDSSENPVSTSPQSCSINIAATSTPSSSNNNDNDDENLPTASSGETTTTVKSSNNYLTSLTVSTGNISFNRKTTKYTINVPETTENITVTGTAEHAKATVQGNGTVALKKGSNTINIVVTAENGSARTYTLTVVRDGEEEIKEETVEEEQTSENVTGLTSLVLKGVKDNGEIVDIALTPEFSKDIFYYECEIPEGITFIDVESESDILDAIVEVTGNENLVDGENLINILITYMDENGEEQTMIYQISAKNQMVETQEIEEKNQGLTPLQIGVIVGSISIATVIIIVLIVKYRRQQNREDDMDFGGYGEPFYIKEEDSLEKQSEELDEKEENKQERLEEGKDKEMHKEAEQIKNDEEDGKPVKKRRFGRNAKNGKHF